MKSKEKINPQETNKNKKSRKKINKKQIISAIMVALIIIGTVLFYQNTNVKAGEWDSAQDFIKAHGESDIIFHDGYLYFASSGRLSSSGTKYHTLGWQVCIYNGDGVLRDVEYFVLDGGVIELFRNDSPKGYSYELYRSDFSVLRGRLSQAGRDALNTPNSTIRLNAGNCVSKNGVDQGWMSDGNAGSGVYYTYDGINNAVSWSAATHEMLKSYYNKSVTGLSYKVEIGSGTGINGVSGSGWYTWGSYATVKATTSNGYSFNNWTDTYSGGQYSTSSTYTIRVTGNTYLRANGKGNTYYINYDANGSTDAYGHGPTGTPAQQSYVYNGGAVSITNSVPSWYGRDFKGWAKSNTATTATVGTGSSISQETKDITLYAVWNLHEFLQTNNFYKKTNGKYVRFATTTHDVAYSKYYKNTNEGVTTPTGYYWNKFATDGWTVLANKNDKDGYGYYEPIEYDIEYNANTGSGAMDSTHHVYDVSSKLRENNGQIYKKGYNFRGWSRTPYGSRLFDDASEVLNLTAYSGKVVLFAVWEPIHYNVAYHGNGQTSGSVATQRNRSYDNTLFGEQYTYAANDFLKQSDVERYDFVGWSQDPNGQTSQTVLPGKTYENLTDVDFATINMYAQWQKDNRDYKVTVEPNGGTVIYDGQEHTTSFVIIGKYGTVFDLALKSPLNSSGYYFNKWNVNNVRTQSIINIPETPSSFRIKGDGTLTASWDTTMNITVNPNGGVVNGHKDNFVIKGKKGDPLILDFSFCDFSLINVAFNTSGCLTTDGAYVKSANYVTSYDYDRSTSVYTNSTTGMTPKAGSKIAYASYIINTSGTVTVNWDIPSSAKTWTMTMDDNGGTGGVEKIYQKYGYGFYVDEDAQVKVSKLDSVPTKNAATFEGYWSTSAQTGGTQYTDKEGNILVPNTTFMNNATWYARWKDIPIPDQEYKVEHYLPTVNASTGAETYGTTASETTSYMGYKDQTVSLSDLTMSGGAFKGYVYSYGAVNGTTTTTTTIVQGRVIKLYYSADYFKLTLTASEGITTTQSGVKTLMKDGNIYYKFGTNVTIKATTTGDYVFANWECLSGGVAGSVNASYVFKMPNTNAAFQANSNSDARFIINYDLNGGTLKDGNPSTYTSKTNTFTLNEPEKEYSYFEGWTGSNGTKPQTGIKIEKGSTGNRDYKANYQWNTYTISLDKQDGTGGSNAYYEKYSVGTYSAYDSANKTVSGSISSITVPTMTGYDFLGYYNKTMESSGENAEQIIDNTGKIIVGNKYFTANTKLYAWWSRSVSKVTLDKQGGSEGSDAYYIRYQDGYYIDSTCNVNITTLTVPELSGRDFEGYYTEKNGSGTKWVDANGKILKDIGRASNITLYANWKNRAYTLTYEYNKPANATNTMSGNTNVSKVIYYNNAYGTLASPSIKGWTFDGWYTTLEYTTEITESTICKGNATAYAKWHANTYTVVFNGNKPSDTDSTISGTMDNLNATYDKTEYLPDVGFTLSGWTFVNWNTEKDGTGITYDKEDFVWNMATGEDAENSTVTLYAQWERNKYNVTLSKGTGIKNTTGTGSYAFEQMIRISASTRAGYEWKNWEGTYNTTTQNYNFKMPAQDVVETANASLINYKITYNYNGGEESKLGTNPTSYNVSNGVSIQYAPYRKGYTFTGWTETIRPYKWNNGFIDINNGNECLHESYPSSIYSDPISLKAGVTYTLNVNGTSDIRWRIFDKSDTYIGNESSEKTYTPSQDCYARILLYSGLDATNRQNITITSNDVDATTLTIPKDSTGNREYVANWKANTFKLKFDGNNATGITGGSGGTMNDVTITYDQELTLPANQYIRTGAAYLRWSNKEEPEERVPDVSEGYIYYENNQHFSVSEVKAFLDLYDVVTDDGKTIFADQDGSTITLYAVWDNAAVIEAGNQYITTDEAATITEEKLYNHIRVTDREETDEIPHLRPGENADGIENYIKDFNANEVKSLPSDCGTAFTVHVRDKVGNITESLIMVYVTDTTSLNALSDDGQERFITKKYSVVDIAGGLNNDSIWNTNSEYKSALQKAVDNSRKDETTSDITIFSAIYKVKNEGTGTVGIEEQWKFDSNEVKEAKESAISDSQDKTVQDKNKIKKFLESIIGNKKTE